MSNLTPIDNRDTNPPKNGALNENALTPDCSGTFETTTGVYTDIIQTDTSVLETTWKLIDPTNLILKLDSFKELTVN